TSRPCRSSSSLVPALTTTSAGSPPLGRSFRYRVKGERSRSRSTVTGSLTGPTPGRTRDRASVDRSGVGSIAGIAAPRRGPGRAGAQARRRDAAPEEDSPEDEREDHDDEDKPDRDQDGAVLPGLAPRPD